MSTGEPSTQPPTPPGNDPEALDALRTDLEGWTVEAVENLIGDRAARALSREQVTPALLAARAEGDDHRAVLTRLLMLGDELTRAQLDRALPRLGTDGAARMGLVTAAGARGDDRVRAAVDLRPYSATTDGGEVDWWIASDLPESVTGAGVTTEHVLGVGGASSMLAGFAVRDPRERVLDLGTGCGIQSLHASLHAKEVVATDISRRALAFAGFNAQLNNAGEWDLREGSMFEPVFGDQFDQVVSNPPFVITPPGAPRYEYRDGGFEGDGVVAAMVSGVGAVLAPGGVAQFLGNWEIRNDADWHARLEQWLEASPTPVDAWVVQRDALDAAEYAETWLRDAGLTRERNPSAFASAYESYLRDFDARGVEAVGFGMVLLRRRADAVAGSAWRRFEQLEGPVNNPLGPHVGRVLAAQEWLASTDDPALLDCAFSVAADVTKETYGRPLSADPEHILLRQGDGFGRSVKADTALAGLMSASDGDLTAGQIAHAICALLDVEPSIMLPGLVPAIRELVLDGFLQTPPQ